MKSPKSALTTWPKDFALDDDRMTYARDHHVAPQATWDDFRDYHLSHGSRFANWEAAWRTWCRRAEEYAREKNPQPVSKKVDNFVDDSTPEQRAEFKRKLHELARGVLKPI